MDPITLLLLFGSGYLVKKITDKTPPVSKITKGYEIIEKENSITLKVLDAGKAFEWAFNYGKTIYDRRLSYDDINKILFNGKFGSIVNIKNQEFLNKLIECLLDGTAYYINPGKQLTKNEYYRLIDNYYLEFLFYDRTYFYTNSLGTLPILKIIDKGYSMGDDCTFVINNKLNINGFDFVKFTKILAELITEKDLKTREELYNYIIFEFCDFNEVKIDAIDNYLIKRSFLQGLVKNNLMDIGEAGDELTDELQILKENYEFSPINKIHEQQIERLNLLNDSVYDSEII